MLKIHHLGRSQSERIVWLCEELGLDYELQHHQRDPVTMLAPPGLKALHPMGAAPVIVDGERVLAESAAVAEYLIQRHGGGRLALAPEHPDYADYLYWFHFANGNLQPAMGRCMVLGRLSLAADDPTHAAMKARLERALAWIDKRLGQVPWLAGAEFTAADIMSVFSLTTMRLFHPVDLAPYANIRAYLARVGAREAYRRAMAKGDPGFAPMLE
ncbi:MAG: glutathione S-transferase family protein [Burkholderiales bacterium]|nr:glutathione S-transferase family protein [Burkholderiales bacterium]